MADDLSNFLDFLYERTEGYVYVATKDTQAVNKAWEQEFFEWPTQKQEVYDFIVLHQAEKDVYVAPALFKAKNALKKSVKGSNVVWVEFDGQQQIDFQDLPEPDCIIRTSSETHKHCYWKVEYIENIELIDSINRRLMYYLEADSSGFDAGQVLRPPQSKNWKHKGLPVTLEKLDLQAAKREYKDFDPAPEIKQEVIKVNSDHLLDVQKLLNDLPLHGKLKKRIVSETAIEPHRSAFLMKIGYELAEEGCNHLQIVSILNYVDERVKKFDGRKDKLTRLSEIAARALLFVEIEEGVTLYSPLDIINYSENLEWIIPGILHRSGFVIVTGAPAAGKTTLTLQAMFDLATAGEFLSFSIPTSQKALFISLEMGVLELKYFYLTHNKVFQSNPVWNDNVRIMDQNVNLVEYEQIIAEFEPTVIFIDSLTELATEELKESESRAITRWIKKVRRRYNCAFVVIHHNRKESGNKKFKETTLNDVYGSFIFGKDVDTALNLERFEDEIALYTLKRRYGAKLVLDLVQDSETLLFSIKAAASNNDSESTGSIGSAGISFNFK